MTAGLRAAALTGAPHGAMLGGTAPVPHRERKKKKSSVIYRFKCKTARSNSEPLCGRCETLSTFKTSLSALYQIPVNLPLAFTHFHLKSLFGLNRQQSTASGLLSLSLECQLKCRFFFFFFPPPHLLVVKDLRKTGQSWKANERSSNNAKVRRLPAGSH